MWTAVSVALYDADGPTEFIPGNVPEETSSDVIVG